MDLWENWKLCEFLSLDNAALLIAGYLPDEYPYAMQHWQIHEWPGSVHAIHTALQSVVSAGLLPATLAWSFLEVKDDESDRIFTDFKNRDLDTAKTLLRFDDIRQWLSGKHYFSSFFTPELEPPDPPVWDPPSQEKTISYLDRNNPYFSIKLKAAIDVWEAVSNNPPKSTSPKEAIKAWLREYADSYELIKDDGTPNETAIEEIAKIVHWRGKGGAIKMPVIHSPEPQF